MSVTKKSNKEISILIGGKKNLIKLNDTNKVKVKIIEKKNKSKNKTITKTLITTNNNNLKNKIPTLIKQIDINKLFEIINILVNIIKIF